MRSQIANHAKQARTLNSMEFTPCAPIVYQGPSSPDAGPQRVHSAQWALIRVMPALHSAPNALQASFPTNPGRQRVPTALQARTPPKPVRVLALNAFLAHSVRKADSRSVPRAHWARFPTTPDPPSVHIARPGNSPIAPGKLFARVALNVCFQARVRLFVRVVRHH